MTEFVEKYVKEYEQRTGIKLDAHNRSTLRSILSKEEEFWDRQQADIIRGFDDGEPQTTVDFNHHNGTN